MTYWKKFDCMANAAIWELNLPAKFQLICRNACKKKKAGEVIYKGLDGVTTAERGSTT